ncbi:50S ribosomal protein L40e [Candidatus Bathyarchaeota archaeon]|nr:50S ribosomal protein L40e [Candidatus Bathyarchaeota archaeon]
MPIRDPFKKQLAQQHRLYVKICRECNCRNSPRAIKCRKCKSHNLRWKRRERVTRR